MDNSPANENLGISSGPILRRRRLNTQKIFNKNLDRTARQVKRNSREINLLKKVVILNTNRVAQLISTQTENAQDSQREEDRQQQLGDESDKADKKEGLLERVGKSVKKTLLAPVEAVGKTVNGVLGNLGKAFMALFAGFVTNKAIKMIQAKMSGDDETFKNMRNTLIKSIAVVGGIFLILKGGLLALPAIITGVVTGIIAIGGAILAFLVSPAGLIALAVAGGVGAFLGLKKLFNKNKEKKLELEKTRGKPIKNSRGRTIGYDKPKGDGSGNTSVVNENTTKNDKVDPFVVLEDNKNLIPFGMYDMVKSEIEKDPSKYDTKEEINAVLSNIPGVDPSKIKYKSSNLNLKSSKYEPTINSVPKKQDVSTLQEAPPNIVDATTNVGGGGVSTLGDKEIATSLPNISSSNFDNNFTLYAKTQYNILV
tara:strand:- start:1708 stop:2982 length:1275 start_codon:yes stop_codon:yes gene_type:complete